MKWREAHSIGNKAEGIIRCTYARLYNKAGKVLFSLQRVSAEERARMVGNHVTGELYMVGTEKDARGVFQWTDYKFDGPEANVNYDMPLVVTSGVNDDKRVPATLTDKAREILTNSLNNTKRVVRYDIYRCYDLDDPDHGFKAGDRIKEAQQYHNDFDRRYTITYPKYHYETEAVNVLRPAYQKLIDILKRKEVVYIRPAAFDWEPIDIKASNLDEQIAAAKRKMDTARAIAIAAGVATLL